MGFEGSYAVRHADCPGCGKKAAACMGHSVWGHSKMCCSDRCGKRVGRAIVQARKSKGYQFFREMKEHAEWQMATIEQEALEELRETTAQAEAR